MVITNLTSQDYWFGPLHLPAGNGQTLQVDDLSDTSLYLTDDSVADAINTLYAASPAKITVVPSAGTVFPRATGTPEVLHGDGSPEGIVYAGQGSVYLRRDNSGGTQLYQKTTGLHLNTGWIGISGSIINPSGTIQMWGGTSAPGGYLLCDGSAVSRSTYADLFAAISTGYGTGDGSTTFNVPDLQGRVPVGKGTNASVNALGVNDGQSVANRRPHHRTSFTDPGHSHTVQAADTSQGSGGDSFTRNAGTGQLDSLTVPSHTTGITIGTGNANDASDTPSFLVVNYIIKT